MLIGYARVSTDYQNLDLQRDALQAAGCERVFEDMVSGARADRTGLATLMSMLRAGNTIDGQRWASAVTVASATPDGRQNRSVTRPQPSGMRWAESTALASMDGQIS